MEFDLENLNAGNWFEMDNGGKICLRVCDGDALRNIRKKTVTKKVEYKKVDNRLERFVVEDANDDLQADMIWDYCIVNWENFFDKNKKPIPCTPENKKLLMGKSIQFAKFVSECLDKLREEIEGEKKEDPEKNC